MGSRGPTDRCHTLHKVNALNEMRVLAGIPRRAAANCRREKGAGAVMIRRCVVESCQMEKEQRRVGVNDRETWQTPELKTRPLRVLPA